MDSIDIEGIMMRMGREGVTMLLKMDDERLADDAEPWTVVLSGPALGEQGFIRAEATTLGACLDQAFTRLRSRPGDWDWLGDHIQ
ncbi:hypothetical protein [Embleya sp. NPDC020630]|uniref:hypothetical protein n=1 Tax=Embleya sp. NPDC020630 TaxID=3363979 RepID=UPI0037B9C5BE